MNIGEAAKATGISIKMLRYYEEIDLVRPANRSYSGYRVYQDMDITTLRFVGRARSWFSGRTDCGFAGSVAEPGPL